jgi:hypothetical protein
LFATVSDTAFLIFLKIRLIIRNIVLQALAKQKILKNYHSIYCVLLRFIALFELQSLVESSLVEKITRK